MPEYLVPMRWHELTDEQFSNADLSSRIAFIAQNLGLLAAGFGFGWILFSMVLTITLGSK